MPSLESALLALALAACIATWLHRSKPTKPSPPAARASRRSRRPAFCASACSPTRHGWSRTPAAAANNGPGPAGRWPRNTRRLLGVKLAAGRGVA